MVSSYGSVLSISSRKGTYLNVKTFTEGSNVRGTERSLSFFNLNGTLRSKFNVN